MERPFNDQRFYDQVSEELKNNKLHDGLWVKAFAKAGGNKNKAESLYIELRVEHLINESQEEIHEELKNNERVKKIHDLEIEKQEVLTEFEVYQRHEDSNYPFSWFVFITFFIFPICTIIYFFVERAYKWGVLTTIWSIALALFAVFFEASGSVVLWPWFALLFFWALLSWWLGVKAFYIVAEAQEPLKSIIKRIDRMDDNERNSMFAEFDKQRRRTTA